MIKIKKGIVNSIIIIILYSNLAYSKDIFSLRVPIGEIETFGRMEKVPKGTLDNQLNEIYRRMKCEEAGGKDLRSLESEWEEIRDILFKKIIRIVKAWDVEDGYTYQDIEDMVVKVFEIIVIKIRTFREEAKFATWVRRIIYNVIQAESRKRDRDKKAVSMFILLSDAQKDSYNTPDWPALGRYIDLLPMEDDSRLVLQLLSERYNIEDIVRETGWTRKKVYMIIVRLPAKLEKAMQKKKEQETDKVEVQMFGLKLSKEDIELLPKESTDRKVVGLISEGYNTCRKIGHQMGWTPEGTRSFIRRMKGRIERVRKSGSINGIRFPMIGKTKISNRTCRFAL